MERTPMGIYIAKIKQMQERIFTGILKERGIEDCNSPQSRILFSLWIEDNITISELSKRTSLAKTTLTSMLDRLETQGHIERIYNPQDRREIKIILTKKAYSLKEPYESSHEDMKKINYKDFTIEEALDFEGKLAKILNNLNNYAENNMK